ncbi:Pr6Pr family membrane protein [Amycolatopsis benzoatilytica]|uniref:Pr6Pr family membrane protein n=1 Tax=Amycolatopsis benzoatilytica TaxID=346045 RepID=UPI000366A0AE|nr:Pr6Pr family membrane protein [Amycolatopsis benzoatilytica]
MSSKARLWFGITAIVALAAIVIQIVAVVPAHGPYPTVTGRVANLFAYFTIISNVLVLVTSAAIARGRAASALMRVLWLDALVGIVVTGVVYQVALAGLTELHGLNLVADILLHRVTPVLCVVGWLFFAPRVLEWRTVAWSLVYPLGWLVFTLIRGSLDGWYPYPFINADKLGYGQISLNCLLIGVFFIALASGAKAADRLLTRAPGEMRSADR